MKRYKRKKKISIKSLSRARSFDCKGIKYLLNPFHSTILLKLSRDTPEFFRSSRLGCLHLPSVLVKLCLIQNTYHRWFHFYSSFLSLSLEDFPDFVSQIFVMYSFLRPPRLSQQSSNFHSEPTSHISRFLYCLPTPSVSHWMLSIIHWHKQAEQRSLRHFLKKRS